jgi:hypothetical protein
MTPRKQEPEVSSNDNTPDTPMTRFDSEADTPETARSPSPTKKQDLTMYEGGRGSPSKSSRRESIFQRIWNKASPSPGKGAIEKKDVYSRKVEKSSRRRRERNKEKSRRGSNDDSDSESKSNGASKPQAPPTNGSLVGTVLSFVDAHPTLPNILSYYAQFVLNAFLVLLTMRVIWSFWTTITADVAAAAKTATAETLAEMAVCAQNYRDNKCDPRTRLPALETICLNWEKCMNQDPEAVGRASVGAHTFAQVFNSFVEPISYKAMVIKSTTLTPRFSC